MKRVVRLTFAKEKILSEHMPKNNKLANKLLVNLLQRIDSLISENDGRINEEIASEIMIATLLFIGNESGINNGDKPSDEQLYSLISNFMAGAMLDLNLGENLQ